MNKYYDSMIEKTKLIKYVELQNITKLTLENLPKYYYSIPASSTGKYHPKFTLGEGGLARHVLFAVEIGVELFNLDIFPFTQLEKDIIISAIILHDGLKLGNNGSKYTVKNHPILMRDFIYNICISNNIPTNESIDIVISCIASHMGQWNEKGMLPKPNSKLEKFVHLCDYLASRKIYDKYY